VTYVRGLAKSAVWSGSNGCDSEYVGGGYISYVTCEIQESGSLSLPVSLIRRQDEVGVVISTLTAQRVRDELHGLCLCRRVAH
jgi:hypothetical protein